MFIIWRVGAPLTTHGSAASFDFSWTGVNSEIRVASFFRSFLVMSLPSSLPVPLEVDVVIIGGGPAGMAVALGLQKQGESAHCHTVDGHAVIIAGP